MSETIKPIIGIASDVRKIHIRHHGMRVCSLYRWHGKGVMRGSLTVERPYVAKFFYTDGTTSSVIQNP